MQLAESQFFFITCSSYLSEHNVHPTLCKVSVELKRNLEHCRTSSPTFFITIITPATSIPGNDGLRAMGRLWHLQVLDASTLSHWPKLQVETPRPGSEKVALGFRMPAPGRRREAWDPAASTTEKERKRGRMRVSTGCATIAQEIPEESKGC